MKIRTITPFCRGYDFKLQPVMEFRHGILGYHKQYQIIHEQSEIFVSNPKDMSARVVSGGDFRALCVAWTLKRWLVPSRPAGLNSKLVRRRLLQ